MENLNLPHHNKYHNGKIYKITDTAYTVCYIGSTVQPLCNRMAEHRKDYKRFKTGATTVVCASFKILDEYGIENCKIELIEAYPCENKEELRKREGYWIKTEDCVNKNVAGRTHKEYHEEHRTRLLELHRVYMKQYNNENTSKIQTRNSIYKKLDKYKEQQK